MGKRILITSFTFPPQQNGVAHVVAAHAAGLAHLGHEVTVATGSDPRRKGDPWNGVKVRQFNTQGNGLPGRGGYIGDIEGYKRYIASFTGDTIICHCWQIWSTDLAIEVFDRIQCSKILVSHGVSAKRLIRKTPKGFTAWVAWKPYLFRLPRLLAKFDHIVVLSERRDTKSFYDHWLMHKLSYERHSVIPNGAYKELGQDAEVHAEAFRNRYRIGKKFMLLYVSNYSYMKNQEMAIEAFFRARLTDTVLVLIGSEINEYGRALIASADVLSTEGRQTIILEKLSPEETSAAFRATDLFICSSRLEVQPLIILEAIAAGRPYICTDVGCVRDIPGGIVVRDVHEMSQAIRKLATDELLRNRLGAEGRAAVEKTLNWGNIVQQYDLLINKLSSPDSINRSIRKSL